MWELDNHSYDSCPEGKKQYLSQSKKKKVSALEKKKSGKWEVEGLYIIHVAQFM